MSERALALPAAPRSVGYWSHSFRRFRRQPAALVGLALIAIVLGVGFTAQWLAPFSYGHFDIHEALQPPLSGRHLLGTDAAGHDTFSRTLYAVRTSIMIGLVVGLLAGFVGVVVGAFAGYYGGAVDAVIMWGVQFLTSIPAIGLLFAGIVLVGRQPRPHWVAEALVLYLWAGMARVVRASLLSLRRTAFVEAALALGASGPRIIFRHLIPNALPEIIVTVSALVGQTILLEATVEFFGYGLDPWATPSLGGLIADGANSGGIDIFQFWWLWAFPSAVLVLVLVCVNYVGDALDLAFNPTAQVRGVELPDR